MLSKNNPTQRDQLEMVALDQLVPQEHLVRKMEAAMDFSFIYWWRNYIRKQGAQALTRSF